MNDTGRKAIAGVSGPGARTVVCPTAEYRAPIYICYDHLCRHCPREDLGYQLIFIPQSSVDPRQYIHPPRVYTRFYNDFRYQVYALSQYGMPPQQSRAGICSFWCHHDIESGPPIQRAWYHGQSSDSNRVLILDDGNQAFIDPISRRTNIYGPPAGSTASLGASSAVGESSEDTTSVQSFKSEASPETPSLRDCSVQSRSPGSPALPLTPRCMYNHAYNTPATYILPTIPHAPGTVEQVELEVLRPSGAVVVAGMVDNDRTPTRDNFGGGGGGAATATPRRIADGFARVNGTTIMNAPSAPRSRGASRGQAHYRGGRPTRIWNWRN